VWALETQTPIVNCELSIILYSFLIHFPTDFCARYCSCLETSAIHLKLGNTVGRMVSIPSRACFSVKLCGQNLQPYYRAAAMQPRYYEPDGRSSVRPSVRPSVCLSVKRVNCDTTKETSVHMVIPYERAIILVFRQ